MGYLDAGGIVDFLCVFVFWKLYYLKMIGFIPSISIAITLFLVKEFRNKQPCPYTNRVGHEKEAI